VNGRVVATLGVGAQELAALGEADGVEPALEVGISRELVTHGLDLQSHIGARVCLCDSLMRVVRDEEGNTHLLVHVGKEAHSRVLDDVAAQLDRVDVHARHVLLDQILNVAHAAIIDATHAPRPSTS
jgi:hypothetical protein